MHRIPICRIESIRIKEGCPMEQTGSRLNLSDREKLTMTGVEEVKSF